VHGQEIAELTAALQRTQELRNSGLARFVTVIAEDPNCTSLPGAVVMDQADYHWRKRRR
jgi:hypothetical protein